jgi:hypothetical protein
MHKKAAAQPTTLSKQQYAQRWPGTGSQGEYFDVKDSQGACSYLLSPDSSYPMNNHGSSYTHSDNPNTIATYDLPPATRPGGRF